MTADVGDGRRKRCAKCDAEKSVDSFSRDRRRRDGRFPYCMVCQIAGQRKIQRHDGPLNGKTCPMCSTPCRGSANRRYCSEYCKNRTQALRKKFDLAPEEYRALLEDCDGRCPICRCKMHRVNVDHNHTTLEVTGTVCTRCNVGLLAYSNHDPEIAARLLEYLSDPPATRVLGRTPVVNPEAHKKSNMHGAWRHKKRRPQ